MGQDGGGRRVQDPGAEAAEARARLDQIREEGGMPRRGDEIAARSGPGADGGEGRVDPPLDWRLTPRNVILQILAVAAFVAAVWFLVALVTDSWMALLK